MSHSTTLPELLGTSASRRTFLKRVVVMGVAVPVVGSMFAACGGDDDDDAESPAAGALRLADGAVEWSVRSPGEAYRTVIAASDDVVLLEESGSRSRRTIALDAADGSERWSRSTRHTPTPPGPGDDQGIVVLTDQDARARRRGRGDRRGAMARRVKRRPARQQPHGRGRLGRGGPRHSLAIPRH